MTRLSLRSLAVVASVVIVFAACVEGPSGPAVSAAAVLLISGDSQKLVVGQHPSQPLVVQIRRRDGGIDSGATVVWTVSAGGGSLDSAQTTADAQGRARAIYLSSDTAGTATVTIASGFAQTHATINLLADTIVTVRALSGDSTAALVGYPVLLIAKAQDEFGNAIKGVPVTWSAARGTLETTATTTDSVGKASVLLDVGPSAGDYVVIASILNASAKFTVLGVAP